MSSWLIWRNGWGGVDLVVPWRHPICNVVYQTAKWHSIYHIQVDNDKTLVMSGMFVASSVTLFWTETPRRFCLYVNPREERICSVFTATIRFIELYIYVIQYDTHRKKVKLAEEVPPHHQWDQTTLARPSEQKMARRTLRTEGRTKRRTGFTQHIAPKESLSCWNWNSNLYWI